MQDLDADVLVDEETAPASAGVSPRRRRRIAALAAVAVALVLPPLLAYAAFGGDLDQQGQAATGNESIPDWGYGGNALHPELPGNAPGQETSGATQQPWQGLDLAAATITLDAWRPSPDGSPACPIGKVTFAGRSAAVPGKATVHLMQTTRVDVDHDDADEFAVVVFCQDTQAGTYQALVLKSVAGGSLATMGQLARSGQSGDDIVAVTPGPGGLINLTVGDVIPCCGTPRSVQVTQVRTFAWQSSGFTQVAGPTTFAVDRSAVNLDIFAPAVHFSGLVGGMSSGTLTVTVHNRGKREVQGVTVAVWPEQPLSPAAGGDWARCLTRDGTNLAMVCPIGDLPIDKTAALTLPLTGLFGSQAITVHLRIGDQTYDTLRVPSYFA